MSTEPPSFQYPSGHLGHLGPQQLSALQAFKRYCADHGSYQPGQAGQAGSTDDATLLRFLRARKFQIEPAYRQFTETEHWRQENRIDEVYETIDVGEYEETRRLYPQWTGRRDKRGMPVYLFDVARLDSKAVSAYENAKILKGIDLDRLQAPPKSMRLFSLYENLVRFVAPWCTSSSFRPYSETPITQGNNIVDISGMGLKQFWDLKSHLQDSSQLATAHYPETLDNIFVIGAPSFFPTIWSWLKKWFDPTVVSKIHVLAPSDVLRELSKYIDVENIPKKYGGELAFEFGDMPDLDLKLLERFEWAGDVRRPAVADGSKLPNAGSAGSSGSEMIGQPVSTDQGERFQKATSESASSRRLPIGPIRWEQGDDGSMVAVAVGSVGGTRRREVVGVLKRGYREVFFPRDGVEEPTAGNPGPKNMI
ncbi:MAG: hypothetical protein TREMPRED_002862 [Tremellales sp. Tagirdzhanova-0007]|nr:MAG: hypothetical protein TREMPRED_002862 [Tremellales sp. Tagirdzhanova-0007]